MQSGDQPPSSSPPAPSCPPPYERSPPRRDAPAWTTPSLHVPQPYVLPHQHLDGVVGSHGGGHAHSGQPATALPQTQGFPRDSSGQTNVLLPQNQGYVHATSVQAHAGLSPNQGYAHATSNKTPTTLHLNQGYAQITSGQTHPVLQPQNGHAVATSTQTHTPTVVPQNQGYFRTTADQRPAASPLNEGHTQAGSVDNETAPCSPVQLFTLHVPVLSSVIPWLGQVTHINAASSHTQNQQYPLESFMNIPLLVPNFPNTTSRALSRAHVATNTTQPNSRVSRTRFISASTSTRELLPAPARKKKTCNWDGRTACLVCVVIFNLAVVAFLSLVLMHVNGVIDLDALALNKLSEMIHDLSGE